MDSEVNFDIHDWSLDHDVTSDFDELKLDDVTPLSTPHDEGYRSRDINILSDELLDLSDDETDFDHVIDNTTLDALLEDVIDNDDTNDHIEMNPFDGLPYSSLYYELMEQRRQLPVWKAKDDFVIAVEESSVVLVSGRTGSGKSTQVPQWCVQFAKESNFQFGSVVCAQPCHLSAMSLAIQVAREMDFTGVGDEVGYRVPNSNCTCANTVLTFTTDDLLLREMMEDPLLHRYNFIVVDEVQERTLASDLLLALFKSIQSARDDLKIIIVSLPHEMERLEEFFEEVPVLDLFFVENPDIPTDAAVEEWRTEGSEELERRRRKEVEHQRMKNIDVIYQPTDQTVLNDVIIDLVMTLHCDQTIAGDIMIFLPTVQTVEEVCERLAREVAMKTLHGASGEAFIIPLHEALTNGTQQVLYDKKRKDSDEPQLHKRRIIVCNEMAESLFSTNDISIIIDSGIDIESVFNSRTRTKCEMRKFISRRSADLRASRCELGGRVYRMYSLEDYQAMDDDTTPSIKRVELTSHILLLKRLLQRLDMSFTDLQFLDPPDPEAYMLALEELDYHGALDESGNLSDLGAVMSEFPLPVPMAKCVISSCGEDCVQEMLTIVAMATSPSPWLVPRGSEEFASMAKRELVDDAGDHFTLLNVYQQFERHKRSESWCIKNFISYSALVSAEKTRAELLRIMEKHELPISAPLQEAKLMEISVKRAILAGYFMQIARDTDGCGNYLIIRDRHVARVHPNSSVRRSSEWIVYNDFLLTENSYVTLVSYVTASWIVQVSPQSYLQNLPDHETKDFLLKLSARWRKRLADEQSHPGAPSRVVVTRDKAETSFNQPAQERGGSDGRPRGQPSNYEDDDDTDVLTQAARGVAYAYHQAADYVGKPEKEEGQCVVQ